MDRQEGAVQNTKSKSVLGAFEWVESIVFALVFVIVIFCSSNFKIVRLSLRFFFFDGLYCFYVINVHLII